MKKYFTIFCIVISLVLVGCGDKDKTNESTNASENVQLSVQDYEQLVGTWSCIDKEAPGSEVTIEKNQKGLLIQYDNEEKAATEFVSKTEELNSTHYQFENKEEELGYYFTLKDDGNIILNRGTTNSKMVGLSKPMEYERIEK
ncbi:hypothetical protein ACYSNW_02765 [Enterococcus sp. LJL99]